MPIYEYKCSKGHVTEVRQTSFEPKRLIVCQCTKCMIQQSRTQTPQVACLIISGSGFEIKNKPIGEKKWF